MSSIEYRTVNVNISSQRPTFEAQQKKKTHNLLLRLTFRLFLDEARLFICVNGLDHFKGSTEVFGIALLTCQ